MKVEILKEGSRVTDHIESERLHKLMQDMCFGEYSNYQVLDGMIVRTDKTRDTFAGAEGATESRYWKFNHLNDGVWEVYEVDSNGVDLGRERTELDESKSIDESLFGKKKVNKSKGTFKVIDGQHKNTIQGGFKNKDDAYTWIEDNKDPEEYSMYKVVEESLTESLHSFEDIIKDSINHLINGRGMDPTDEDFAEEVVGDLERGNYAHLSHIDGAICPAEGSMEEYADWYDKVVAEVANQLKKMHKEDLNEDISNDFCVYTSSPNGCYKEFCGSEEDCKKWITDNKSKFPSSTRITIQPASEKAKWGRDFDLNESVSSGKYSLNFGHWRTGNGKSFNSERELIEFLEDNYVENGTIVTQSQNVTDQFSKYFQHPPKDAHVSREFFDRGYEMIVGEGEPGSGLFNESFDIDKLNTELAEFGDAYAFEEDDQICIDCGSSETLKKVKAKYNIDNKHSFDSPVSHTAYLSKSTLDESVTDMPIEDIEAFITEVKERFPGSEVVFDGDTNEIRISLR